jgi:hypothetical protein
MGFLDNSGDIILDAVLTDAGRARLARGDCSFNIKKFALGDDEIDYGLYNKAHPSGSQYYDLEILQTPVLEAFTNNTSAMNSKLITMPSPNEYFLPVIRLHNEGAYAMNSDTNSFVVVVNEETANFCIGANTTGVSPLALPTGILNGFDPATAVQGSGIRADQGIDNNDRPPTTPGGLPGYLTETAYFLQMDNRLGSPRLPNGASGGTYSYLDDDQIASYFLTLPGNQGPLEGRQDLYVANIQNTTAAGPIAGVRGTRVWFTIKAGPELADSDSLFQRIGTQVASGEADITAQRTLQTYWYIDSIVRLTGVNTGYRIDIPIRYVRKY